jgi:GcrA cell cycle regulator
VKVSAAVRSRAPLGGGLSRNAVIGKVHRLGLAARPERGHGETIPKPAKRSCDRVVKVKAVAKLNIFKAPHPEPVKLEDGSLIGTADLKDRHCRWPHGDVGASDFHYCGGDKVGGSSWCEFHQVRASEKSQPRSPEAGSLGRSVQGNKAERQFAKMFG